jgi:hypothetical protein
VRGFGDRVETLLIKFKGADRSPWRNKFTICKAEIPAFHSFLSGGQIAPNLGGKPVNSVQYFGRLLRAFPALPGVCWIQGL